MSGPAAQPPVNVGMDVKGKVCVVTGGGSGIGKALAIACAEQGAAAVMVADVERAAAVAVAASLKNERGEVIGAGLRVDCSSEMSVRRMITTTEFRLGPIDCFFSNAGIPSNGGVETPNEEFNEIWLVNVMAHIYAARHLFPLYAGRGGGCFVITASAAGLLTQVGSLPYSLTKHAAVALAEWLAITHYEEGIYVGALCPQAVNTNFLPAGMEDGNVAAMDGVLEPIDVARCVLEAQAAGQFLILPHPQVQRYFATKANNYDKWLRGMRRLHGLYGNATRMAPPVGLPKSKM